MSRIDLVDDFDLSSTKNTTFLKRTVRTRKQGNSQKKKIVFQLPIFRANMLVSGRVYASPKKAE